MVWYSAKPLVGGLVVAVFLVFAAFAAVQAWPLMFPDRVTTLQPDPACNLRAGTCITRVGNGAEVNFSIEPRTIPALEPLRLSVRLDGIVAQQVQVNFSGVDMNMGFNRVALLEKSPGQYIGQSTLSVCVRAAMEWEASVLIDTEQESYSVPFRFIVANPHVRKIGNKISNGGL